MDADNAMGLLVAACAGFLLLELLPRSVRPRVWTPAQHLRAATLFSVCGACSTLLAVDRFVAPMESVLERMPVEYAAAGVGLLVALSVVATAERPRSPLSYFLVGSG